MFKNRLKERLSHPAIFALPVWAIIMLFLPPLFQKYKISTVSEKHTPENIWYYYSDMNSDGNSEEISIDLNDTKQTKIIIRKGGKIINEYDVKDQISKWNRLFFNDYDQDGFQELYVFTMNDDSIFLSIIDPFRYNRIILERRFIDFRYQVNFSDDIPYIVPVGMMSHQNNQLKDFIFYINTGFSRKPRRIYRYMVLEDSLIKSPETSVAIIGCSIFDIDGNNLPNCVISTLATGNYKNENPPFSDSYSWLMILNNDLDFRFEPVKLMPHPARSIATYFKSGKEKYILLFHDYLGTENISSGFDLYSLNGIKISTFLLNDFEAEYSSIVIPRNSVKGSFYFIKNRKTEITEYSKDFKKIKNLRIPEIAYGTPIYLMDLDSDGKDEFIFKGRDH